MALNPRYPPAGVTPTRAQEADSRSVTDQPMPRPRRQPRAPRAGEFLIGRAGYGTLRPAPRPRT